MQLPAQKGRVAVLHFATQHLIANHHDASYPAHAAAHTRDAAGRQAVAAPLPASNRCSSSICCGCKSRRHGKWQAATQRSRIKLTVCNWAADLDACLLLLLLGKLLLAVLLLLPAAISMRCARSSSSAYTSSLTTNNGFCYGLCIEHQL
jgi:hypothetical protein